MSDPSQPAEWDGTRLPRLSTADEVLDQLDHLDSPNSIVPLRSDATMAPPALPSNTQPRPTNAETRDPPPFVFQDHNWQPVASPTFKTLDTIFLQGLHIEVTLGTDAWNRPHKPQPIILSVSFLMDTTSTGISDDISHTFSYGHVCSEVTGKLDRRNFPSLDHLNTELASLAEDWPVEILKIATLAPKALLRVDTRSNGTRGGLECKVVLRRPQSRMRGVRHPAWCIYSHVWTIAAIKPACIIGVNPHERLEKQIVCIELRIYGEQENKAYAEQMKEGQGMWRRMVRRTCEVVEPTAFKTLEALAALIAGMLLEEFPCPRVIVRVEKPSALTFVEGAGVTITRDRANLGLR